MHGHLLSPVLYQPLCWVLICIAARKAKAPTPSFRGRHWEVVRQKSSSSSQKGKGRSKTCSPEWARGTWGGFGGFCGGFQNWSAVLELSPICTQWTTFHPCWQVAVLPGRQPPGPASLPTRRERVALGGFQRLSRLQSWPSLLFALSILFSASPLSLLTGLVLEPSLPSPPSSGVLMPKWVDKIKNYAFVFSFRIARTSCYTLYIYRQ